MIGKVTLTTIALTTIARTRSEALADAAASLRDLAAAEAKVERASETRRSLPPGSSRARVTTANARWSTACEQRDRVQRIAAAALSEAGL